MKWPRLVREASHQVLTAGHRAGSCQGHMTGKGRKKETGRTGKEKGASINRKQPVSSLPLKSQVATSTGPYSQSTGDPGSVSCAQLNPGKHLGSSEENDQALIPWSRAPGEDKEKVKWWAERKGTMMAQEGHSEELADVGWRGMEAKTAVEERLATGMLVHAGFITGRMVDAPAALFGDLVVM